MDLMKHRKLFERVADAILESVPEGDPDRGALTTSVWAMLVEFCDSRKGHYMTRRRTERYIEDRARPYFGMDAAQLKQEFLVDGLFDELMGMSHSVFEQAKKTLLACGRVVDLSVEENNAMVARCDELVSQVKTFNRDAAKMHATSLKADLALMRHPDITLYSSRIRSYFAQLPACDREKSWHTIGKTSRAAPNRAADRASRPRSRSTEHATSFGIPRQLPLML